MLNDELKSLPGCWDDLTPTEVETIHQADEIPYTTYAVLEPLQPPSLNQTLVSVHLADSSLSSTANDLCNAVVGLCAVLFLFSVSCLTIAIIGTAVIEQTRTQTQEVGL